MADWQGVDMRKHMPCSAIACTRSGPHIIADIPLCATHRDYLKIAVADPTWISPDQVTEYKSIVYYVTWDNGRTVKIGTTTHPRQRFMSLTAEHRRPLKLLAAHPGSYEEEAAQHFRFRSIRVTGERELFRQEQILVDHIAEVKATWPNWKQIVNEVTSRHEPRRGDLLKVLPSPS